MRQCVQTLEVLVCIMPCHQMRLGPQQLLLRDQLPCSDAVLSMLAHKTTHQDRQHVKGHPKQGTCIELHMPGQHTLRAQTVAQLHARRRSTAQLCNQLAAAMHTKTPQRQQSNTHSVFASNVSVISARPARTTAFRQGQVPAYTSTMQAGRYRPAAATPNKHCGAVQTCIECCHTLSEHAVPNCCRTPAAGLKQRRITTCYES